MSGTLPHTPSPLNPVNPVQNNFAQRKAANWNVRGARKDSFWLPFEDGWVFPWGTNHLSGVEVIAYGQVWATPFDTNAVASADTPFEIVRGLTSFAYELTPSNSYRFVWTDAAINRDTNNLVTAVLELFRNGDVSVTTNGVAAHLPRELPFEHHGYGQDDEWVAANFTNASEILAVGYPQWVDAQVGERLTNGLYKLSVALADDLPETTFLTVGDLAVAVTNAGEYVFLLEKGPAYDLTVFPPSSNVTISAVDDVPTMRGTPMMRSFGGVDYGTNDSPQVSCSLSVQSVHFINEGDRPERVYPVSVSLICPVETNAVADISWEGSDNALFWSDSAATQPLSSLSGISLSSVTEESGGASYT
ncbi:MAG: hypothetical protein PUJ80_05930, partial [Verrucomicrobiota bacterium]|nr:hypothetical protein [Verrucomicrobiota bacterium]